MSSDKSWRVLATLEFPSGVRNLVSLPEDYSSLINSAASHRCPNNVVGDRQHPMMCLACGAILCSRSNCCQERVNNSLLGPCNAHLTRCGGAQGGGAFLSLRRCETVLLAEKRRGRQLCDKCRQTCA